MTKVSIRTKAISGNRKSLYLDFYPAITHPDTGKHTRREFLGLHLFDKPKTPFDKQHNKDTKALAEGIRAKRQIEIQNGQYGFLSTSKQDANFITYFKELGDSHKQRNREIWLCALHYLETFTGGTLRFSDVTPRFCNDFKEYILTAPRIRSQQQTISQNSAYAYFNKLLAAVKQAYRDGYLNTDVSVSVERIKEAETERQYLTMDELNTLAKTECTLPILKQAALFAALTGLRFSDIQKLVWAEIQYSNDTGYSLHFRQKKTKGVEVLPISEQAFNLLGERGEPDEVVFAGLQYSAFMNFHLKRWVLKAGITKDISFHCFRHTYATLQLSAGTDIFTVSKLLGHRELKTTMIYAKIMDKAKREAANKITLDIK